MKYTIPLYLLILSLLTAIYFVTFSALSFNWYVNITEFKALDACVGDEVILYQSTRTPRWGMKATSYSQIVRFEGVNKVETTIIRGTVDNPISYGYEPNTTDARFETRWFESNGERYTWTKSGIYGANDWVTIYPLPFIKIEHFNKAADAQFNVVNCN